MATYDVTGSVNSGPFRVGLMIDGQQMNVERDDSGNFAFTGVAASTASPVPYELRAIGPTGFLVTFKVSLKDQASPASGSDSNPTPPPPIAPKRTLIYDGTIAVK
jgi:hypothetical protein